MLEEDEAILLTRVLKRTPVLIGRRVMSDFAEDRCDVRIVPEADLARPAHFRSIMTFAVRRRPQILQKISGDDPHFRRAFEGAARPRSG
jgi:hypothetical protein